MSIIPALMLVAYKLPHLSRKEQMTIANLVQYQSTTQNADEYLKVLDNVINEIKDGKDD